LSCTNSFQDGGSYLHDVSKNGTTDEDHVLPPRWNVFAPLPAYLLNLLSVEAEVKQIVLRKQCFQDGGSYLHDVSKNGTTYEDKVLSSQRQDLRPYLPTLHFVCSNKAYCPDHVFQNCDANLHESARTAPQMKTMSLLRGGMFSSVPIKKIYVFQDGGSYLHDVSKNGTTDEDHVLPPRGMYLRPYLPTVPFVCSKIADCSDQMFQDDGSYLHDISKNGTTDEDHVLPPRRNVFFNLLALPSVPLYCSNLWFQKSRLSCANSVSKMAVHTFMTSARTAPPMKTMSFLRAECICSPTCLLYLSSVLI
jgi:hypothetical protein